MKFNRFSPFLAASFHLYKLESVLSLSNNPSKLNIWAINDPTPLRGLAGVNEKFFNTVKCVGAIFTLSLTNISFIYNIETVSELDLLYKLYAFNGIGS